MKKFVFIVMIVSALPVLAQTGEADFSFEKEVHKFGKAQEGEILEFTYIFTNSGTAPLLISDIKVTCGCTKPEFPFSPVPPGQQGTIKVSFNTKGKIGYQNRTLEIISNAKKSPKVISFRGTVKEKQK